MTRKELLRDKFRLSALQENAITKLIQAYPKNPQTFTPLYEKTCRKLVPGFLESNKTFYWGRAQKILQLVSYLAKQHGVEHFGIDGYYSGWRNCPQYSYVNTGQTYDLTLLFSYHKKKFFVAAWGDLVEKYDKKKEW